MKKKFIALLTSVVFALTLALSSVPASAGAIDLQIGSSNLALEDLSTDITTEFWSWTAATKTLTLTGYNGGPIYSSSRLSSLTVNLKEGTDNIITNPAASDCPGLDIAQNLTLTGSGNLTILNNSDYDAIYCEAGQLIISMAGDLTINATMGDDGIYASDLGLVVNGTGNINITCYNDGFDSASSMEIGGSGDIVVISRASSGFEADTITFDRDGLIRVTSDDECVDGDDGITVTGKTALIFSTDSDNGLYSSDGDIRFFGSGSVQVTTEDAAIRTGKNLIFAGTSDVILKSTGEYAVSLTSPDSKVLLNGEKGGNICFTAKTGSPAIFNENTTDVIGGTNRDKYKVVSGAPNESLYILAPLATPTGDSVNTGLWIALISVAILGCAALLFVKKAR